MSMQPSAQGIASLYMGNPGALQQKIKKEEQAKPGMPPDLQKLMALNIVTNEQDAAKRQQALNALNSMAPAGGQPPTVAQSIQQQAKQKLQAQMLQQQRQQQGLAALAKQQPGQEVPEGTQFAQAQPSGIDDLPVDMEFAGGGIVAFSDGKSVPRVSAPVGNPQSELIDFLRRIGLTPEEFTHSPPKAQAEIRDMFRTSQEASKVLNGPSAAAPAAQAAAPAAQAAAPAARRGILGLLGRLVSAPVNVGTGVIEGGAHASQYATDVLASATPEQRRDFYKNPMVGAMGGDTSLAAAILNQGTETQSAAEAAKNQPQKVTVGTPTRQSLGDKIAPRRSLEEIMAEQPPRRAPATPSTKPTAPAPANQPAATPAAQADTPISGLDALYEQNLRKRMELDPNARAQAVAQRLEQMVGRADTSQYDRLMTELEGRRKQFNAPEPGFGAFMELMQQIAAQGPQRTSAEAGARGAAGLTALNKERQAQQFELTKQMVDVAQKKLDTERGYKKELFSLTEKERDEVDKMVGEATKEYGLNKRDADKYRRDVELKMMEHKQQLALEGARARTAAANRPFNALEQQFNMLKTGNPATDAALLNRLLAEQAEAKRPGFDQELITKFRKSNEKVLDELRKKGSMTAEIIKKDMDQKRADLRNAAIAMGLDPDMIAELRTASGGGTNSKLLSDADKIVGGK